jgi:hypothetical protein
MAHFAEIDENNIVIRVVVVLDEEEHRGHEFLSQDLGLGGTWLKTSYNTFVGKHTLGGTPYRLNYASPGGIYDPETDSFYHPQPFPSFILDKTTGTWSAPIPKPDDTEDVFYIWDEENVNWKAVEVSKL